MKTYNLEEIKNLVKNNNPNFIEEENNKQDSYSIEEFDETKTRILKFIFYKKRTENEIRKKFSNQYRDDLLDDVIEDLREKGYINDGDYITRAINEFMALRNLSIKEIKYKLISKGIKNSEIEKYIDNNFEELKDYEVNSAKNIVKKKKKNMDEFEIKRFLIRKGYREESIKEAL